MTRKNRHTLIWAALVIGCASPVAAAIWSNLDAQGRIAMVVGVAGWIAAILRIDEAIQRRQSAEASGSLMIGSATLLVIELIGSLAFPKVFALAFFWPAVWIGASLRLIPDSGSDFVPALVLTLLCGAQALGCAYVLGKLIPLRSRQSSPAPSSNSVANDCT